MFNLSAGLFRAIYFAHPEHVDNLNAGHFGLWSTQ